MILFNAVIAVLVLIGLWWMMSGWHATGKELTEKGLKALRFFTVLSNILAGIAAIVVVAAASLGKGLQGALILKYAATVGVMLTFFVTACFLAPKDGKDFMKLYTGANFLFHLLVPILCVVSFVAIERPSMSFGATLIAVIPVVLYGVYYLVTGLRHRDGDRVDPKYDWYGFFRGGVHTAPIVIAILFFSSWIMAIVLWLVTL